MSGPSYSIAIRTLGTAGEFFRQELESIMLQTVRPERVVVYIAKGYERLADTVGVEEYVWVGKGMVAQRALRYDEISSEFILLLDDDMLLAPDSVERMLRAMKEHDADCVGADVFQNHKMSLKTKFFSAVTNLVFPHWGRKWAFKIHRNGSFSYNNRPKKSYYWSQSCGGPVMMWRKESLRRIHLEDELWLDKLGFAYGDDALESFKLFRNGGRLGVMYDSGIRNLDAGSSSTAFKKSPNRIYVRTKASFMIWWRCCYRYGTDTAWSRFLAVCAFLFKTIWLLPVMCAAGRPGAYLRGLRDGWKEVHSEAFQAIPAYSLPKE
jgi:GT2 family glycosyltransferase